MPRERWTDERLDEAFDRIDGEIRELRVEMRAGFDRIDKRFDQMDKRFEQIDKRFEQIDQRFERVDERFERVNDKFDTMQTEMTARFDAVQRNMTTWAIALFSATVTLNAAAIAAISFA